MFKETNRERRRRQKEMNEMNVELWAKEKEEKTFS